MCETAQTVTQDQANQGISNREVATPQGVSQNSHEPFILYINKHLLQPLTLFDLTQLLNGIFFMVFLTVNFFI